MARQRGTPAESRFPNEKLNIGIIGAVGRGQANTDGVQGENIVNLCDVNENHLQQAAKRFPAAKQYRDWHRLLDQKDVDAVAVSTPDHHHALASVAAMKRGKHVYCEKPLAHSVHEARTAQETYKKVVFGAALANRLGVACHSPCQCSSPTVLPIQADSLRQGERATKGRTRRHEGPARLASKKRAGVQFRLPSHLADMGPFPFASDLVRARSPQ